MNLKHDNGGNMKAVLDRRQQQSSQAAVRVAAGGWRDQRIAYAAAMLNMRPEVLLCRLGELWSGVTARGQRRMPSLFVAVAIGKRRRVGLVREVLCDPIVGFAELVEDGGDDLDLDLSAVFGGMEWLGNLRQAATAGGDARANSAVRDERGRFAGGATRERILERVGAAPVSAAQLVEDLNLSPRTIGRHVQELEAEGVIVCDESGQLWMDNGTVSGADNGTVSGTVNGVDAGPASPASTSALTPTLTPVEDLTRVREREEDVRTTRAGARAGGHGGSVFLQTYQGGDDASPPPPGPTAQGEGERRALSLLEMTALLHPQDRDSAARRIWAAQAATRRAIDQSQPDPPADKEAMAPVLQLLERYSPAQLMHVLRVHEQQAREFPLDKLRWLNGRSNWTEDAVVRALAKALPARTKRSDRPRREREQALQAWRDIEQTAAELPRGQSPRRLDPEHPADLVGVLQDIRSHELIQDLGGWDVVRQLTRETRTAFLARYHRRRGAA
ncbi:MAG: winged helix-turn-helix domain-containing protein [Myxococcota bacterium]